MEDELMCAICLDVADDAVETNCCHHFYCEGCVKGLKQCPHCRNNSMTLVESHVIRRIIGNLPIKCSNHGCGIETTRSNLVDHMKTCEYQRHTCPAPMCSYAGGKSNFCQHIVAQHTSELIRNVGKLFALDEVCEEKDDDRIATRFNENGTRSRLGSNGKFYCGGGLNGGYCQCCNGGCGPTDGCNCRACMKLDIQQRKLPKSWYVNRWGASCRVGSTGRIYCGRNLLREPGCDGYCGPTDGPNCSACQILQSQLSSRKIGPTQTESAQSKNRRYE